MNQRIAVIVGVTDYSKARESNLRYAGQDALRVATELADYGGFDPSNIMLFADEIASSRFEVRQPNNSDILEALKVGCNDATSSTLIVFYFAGHGVELDKEPYLITGDSRIAVLKETSLSVGTINEFLRASDAGCSLRLFDACRNVTGRRSLVEQGMTRSIADAFAAHIGGSATIFSCSAGESSFEPGDLEQGVFSYYLCEGLSGMAADATGNVTVEGLAAYVKLSVANWCEKNGNRQTPHFVCDLSGPLVLTSITPTPKDDTLEIDAVTPPSAIERLQKAAEAHAIRATSHVRAATMTTQAACNGAANTVFSEIREKFNQLQLPGSVQDETLYSNIVDVSSLCAQTFTAQMKAARVRAEFCGYSPAMRLRLRFSQTMYPNSEIIVGVAQFNFFYWIWMECVVVKSEAQKTWSPSTERDSKYWSFVPSSITDETKVEPVIEELLDRYVAQWEAWSGELVTHLNERFSVLDSGDGVI